MTSTWPQDWFEQFWSIYPKKVGKIYARQCLWKYSRSVEWSVIIEATKAYARFVQGKEWQFIPNPSTWINQGRWEDVLPAPAQEDIAWRTERAVQETIRRRMQ